jgi:uroporphyrinogen decarboxylase
MKPRERVLAALNHRSPDRLPIDFGGTRWSAIAAKAYPRLRKALGLQERPVRIYDPIMQLAVVDEDVLARFGVDTIELGRGFDFDHQAWADWTLPDGTACEILAWAVPEWHKGEWVLRSHSGRIIGHMPEGVSYFEQEYFPFAEESASGSIPEAIRESMWTAIPRPPAQLLQSAEGLKRLTEGAKLLREKTERAVIGIFGGQLFEMGQFLYRVDNFFMMMAGEPKRAHEFLDRLMEIHLANLEKFLTAVGPSIDVLGFSDDLGMQTGPLMSKQMYRDFFKPRHKILWERAKKLADVKVLLHCCGSVRQLIPELIEAGLDAINPVQITCAGMDVKELKAEFGQEMVFWGGGCDTQTILPYATPEVVRSHVKKQVEAFGPNGGFIFTQVHNIQADVPADNIIAMFDAAQGRDH